MSLRKYLNKNKIGGLVLIIVIIIAFGFGGFGGGFLSNNQNNIVKINKTNITSQDLINYINQSGISEKAIQENLDKNIIEELLSSLVSITLLNLEVEDFYIKISQSSLSKKIRSNNNFKDENGNFQRLKYEKFLLENNLSAPLFEKRLRDRELQKKLFDFIGAGTVSPQFLVKKLFETENRKLNIDFINLEDFYKESKDVTDQEVINFVNENSDQLKVDHMDFKYALINPKILIGINDFNQEFFDKIDEIENDILNEVSFDTIISKFELESKFIEDYKFSDKSSKIEKRIYEVRNNSLFDIFENGEDFIIYKIENFEQKAPNLNDPQTKKEILKLIDQKNKFDYNRNLLEKIRDKDFTKNDFLELGKDKIKTLTLNSIRDNKKFEINSVQMLYSLPINSFTLINDEKNNVYIVEIKSYDDKNLQLNTEDFNNFFNKKNIKIRNDILKSYDLFLNEKYNVKINQIAINNVKNLFQ